MSERWPVGTRVRKANSEPGDGHPDGAGGQVVLPRMQLFARQGPGDLDGMVMAQMMGPLSPDDYELDQGVAEGNCYFVEWDDAPGLAVLTSAKKLVLG